ncbi:S-adenosyl-L-methionine-dependent methyltransferase [Aspergillus pseudotamarii]|uniref:S-adenosyl-L-methionine-dependent methyltransferase n=1 Tax=Aspergillus pseudotamarii TaxID=132259 RepID=A0A5N6SJ40_ASPPS|nr:S-adenosyl-L-methionine-dependent methyltransferase [Aspergillus pseudotamarii]KAE8134696.1 S-adenosyl-L-methionine-dependent methyltransferase [Aspergillus pseudotamarii]
MKLKASFAYSKRCHLRCLSASSHTARQFSTATIHLNKDDDSANVWKLTQEDVAHYWKGYLATRPKYTDAFYNLIYNYHTSHSQSNPPSFSVAHDVGAGPGQVSAKLAQRFSHVVVSDNNENHVNYAKHFLPTINGSESRFSFAVAKGEDLGSKYPPASADLVVSALMFPLMDTLSALRSFHALLKPGGTLAVWFYGRAHFAELEYAARCQPLLDRIINHHFSGVITGGSPEHTAGWKHVADGIASWLDYIPFAEEDWGSVVRHKWNTKWTTLGFFGNEACDFPVEPRSSVTDKEVVIERDDRNLWRKHWNVGQLREFVEYIYPFQGMEEEYVKPLWAQLEREMGGLHARRAFSWPVVLILATRK